MKKENKGSDASRLHQCSEAKISLCGGKTQSQNILARVSQKKNVAWEAQSGMGKPFPWSEGNSSTPSR